MDDQSRNLILATALSFLVILAWFFLFPPEPPAPATTQPERASRAPPPPPVAGTATRRRSCRRRRRSRSRRRWRDRRAADRTARLRLDVAGGGRIDACELRDYKARSTTNSPMVTLLRPPGAAEAYYALYGWAPAAGCRRRGARADDAMVGRERRRR